MSFGFASPRLLLGATFLLGVAGALAAPAWVSIAPLLVPRRDLESATAVNTAGYNLSRALGPALGGLVIAWVGISAPFWIYAASNVAVLAALLWWRPPRRVTSSLPAERLTTAIRTGVRHARHNRHLHATLVRTLAFFPFAAAYWALLPLIAREQPAQGAAFYGLLLGGIGVGAILGSASLSLLQLLARAGFAGRGGDCRHGGRARPVRRRRATRSARCRAGRARRRDVDRHHLDALCLGAGRAARLGARPRPGDLPDRHFRRDDLRQRALGPCRDAAQRRRRALLRRGRARSPAFR